MENKTAIILAGGSNKRIKMLKPLINVGGEKILVRINDSIKEIFSQILLVVRKKQNDSIVKLGKELGMEIIEEEENGLGGVMYFTDTKPVEHCLLFARLNSDDVK